MRYQVSPVLETNKPVEFALAGEISRRLAAVTEQWLLPAPHANPGMLAMFHERDRLPLRQMMPWAGEFAGKYLTAAAEILALTRDPRLETHLRQFVAELLSAQDADGYLGPWPKPFRLGLAGPPPNSGQPWDLWGHYHAMLGLLEWHDAVEDSAAVAAARRIADLLCRTFLGTGHRVHEVGELEMNMAPYHALWLLFARSGERRYAELADEIERDFEEPPAGDYVRTVLQGVPFHQTPKPRWESLHAIQGLAEKFFLTGDAKYRQAFEHLWWSMLEGDRHNHGGFTSGERATGDPYRLGPVETCCTVAWSALSVDMLRLTGYSKVADELELTLFNSGLGLMNPTGRWVTYDTPMDGRREASIHSLAFQSRAGTNELNCCAVNGPRVLGLLNAWALMRRNNAVVLNYYGPGTMSCALPSGRRGRLTQTTDYPRTARVEIRLDLDEAESFPLALRIPYWSERTTVRVDGAPGPEATAGQYLALERRWQAGDTIVMEFDFRPHFWAWEPGYFYTDWDTKWRVCGPAAKPVPEARAAILAREGVGLPAGELTSPGGWLDFHRGPRGPGDTVFLFTELESAAEATLPIRFAAAWWSVITVNGEKVFDDESCGYDGDVSVRLCRLNLPLRRGRNRIGWAVTRHPNHPTWCLSVGRSEPFTRVPATDFRLCSIYRGPLLLAFDHRYNSMDVELIPGLDARELAMEVIAAEVSPRPWLLVGCRDVSGGSVRLCDFASAGVTGNPYRTWLNVRGVAPGGFSRANPLRSVRPPGG